MVQLKRVKYKSLNLDYIASSSVRLSNHTKSKAMYNCRNQNGL